MPGLDPGIRASTACSMGDPASPPFVMRGLVPRIHFGPERRRDVDGRIPGSSPGKCGHDVLGETQAERDNRSPWERREQRPRDASLMLLTLVAKNGLSAVA